MRVEWSQGKVKLNDVLQSVLELDLIRRAKEMKVELKADGLRGSNGLYVHLWLIVVSLVAQIIFVFTISFS